MARYTYVNGKWNLTAKEQLLSKSNKISPRKNLNLWPITSLQRSKWASCPIREIAGCACAGNAWIVFPTTLGWRSRHASQHVRHALVVMHVGALTSGVFWSRWPGKRSRHSRRMHNPQFNVSGKRPIGPWKSQNIATYVKADSRFAPRQWETAYLSNEVFHWLGAIIESTLYVLQLTSVGVIHTESVKTTSM